MRLEELNIDVSHETAERLDAYFALLKKWQPAINLVAPSTLADAWNRHFIDSMQITNFIPERVVLADLGSGAGFPGLVLAMLRPDLNIHLIESDERKAEFLRTVSRETKTPVTVHADRLVRLTDKIKPQWVTARAMAELRKLLIYIEPWSGADDEFVALFMKGAKAQDEIDAARKSHDFHLEKYTSVTEPQASILKLSSIKRKS